MNNENLKDIKREDKKARKPFIIILIVSSLLGGVVGFFSVYLQKNIGNVFTKELINTVTTMIPYINWILLIIIAIVVNHLYKKSRGIFKSWDGENEEEMTRIEVLLSYALGFTSCFMIISFMLFPMGFSGMEDKDLYNIYTVIHFGVIFFGFIASIFFVTISQQKIINFTKEMNPEKKGSIYDIKFSKKWEQSCDEAERFAIYKAAYKAYSAVNLTCIALWLVCTLGVLLWNMGIMSLVMVSIIWFVLNTTYFVEVIRFAKNPSALRQ